MKKLTLKTLLIALLVAPTHYLQAQPSRPNPQTCNCSQEIQPLTLRIKNLEETVKNLKTTVDNLQKKVENLRNPRCRSQESQFVELRNSIVSYLEIWEICKDRPYKRYRANEELVFNSPDNDFFSCVERQTITKPANLTGGFQNFNQATLETFLNEYHTARQQTGQVKKAWRFWDHIHAGFSTCAKNLNMRSDFHISVKNLLLQDVHSFCKRITEFFETQIQRQSNNNSYQDESLRNNILPIFKEAYDKIRNKTWNCQ